jgi:glycosyltransferase involved in cell wall biosynthesis
MLNVYHVGHFAQDLPNGVDRVIYNLGRLLEHDIRFHVVSFTETDDTAYRHHVDGNVQVHHFGKLKKFDFGLPSRFFDWLNDLPAGSLLHLHSVFAPPNAVIASTCRRRGIPYVFTPHDSYVPESMRTSRLRKLAYMALLERRVLDGASAIHALTSEGADCISRYSANRRITLIRNFIPDPDPALFRPLNERQGFVFVGRMDVFQKGLDLLIPAYAKLRHWALECDPLTLVGPADQEQERKLQKLIGACGLEEGRDVIRVGQVSDAEKLRLIASARFYVQLSRFEGFGLSVAEALALGTPCIVTPAIPLAEGIEKFGAGLIATAETAGDVLRASSTMDDSSYALRSAGALDFHRRELSSGAVREAFLNLYGGIVPISPAGQHQPAGKEHKTLSEKLSQERVTP